MTVGTLSRTMAEVEFRRWQKDAERRMLWPRRIELYLAQIAMMVTAGAGGKNLKLKDFLMDPKDDMPADEYGESTSGVSTVGYAISAMTGANVRVLGQGRKKRKQRV